MTGKYVRRLLAALLTLAMVAALLVVPAAAEAATYTFDAAELTAAADKEPLTGAAFAEGYIATFGELTKRTSSDGSVKSVEVGKAGKSGFTFTVGGTAQVKVEFSSTGGSNSSTVGLWDANDQLVANNEGLSVVSGTGKTPVTWTGLSAGTYKVVSPDATEYDRGARVYTITVEDSAGARAPRKAWAEVADPAVTGVKVEGGRIQVSYTMDVGYDGADAVTVTMLGDVTAAADGKDGVAVFTPKASGKYTFSVTATREGETDKTGHSDQAVDFTLPLAAPVIANATSNGEGKLNVDWDAVAEATGYNVYMDGAAKPVNAQPITGTDFEVTGLALDSTHSFTVTALRGSEESAHSEAKEGTATAKRQQAWRFATFGASTKADKNYAEGDLNRDGKVRVVSSAGAGKILANSTDGIAFYYTAIPADQNFTLRSKVHVNGWENRSAQNGFGVAALDRVGDRATDFWNNSYMALGVRYAYYYDKDTGTIYAEEDPNHLGEKINMRLGIASIAKSGVTQEGLDAMGGEITTPPGFTTSTQPLESYAVAEGKGPGTYNLVAGGTALEWPSLDGALSDFVLEVQRNNTGYFLSYYDLDGKLIKQNKTYEPDALNQLDSEFIYAGFFTAREMDATFSDVTLKVNDPSQDPAPEAKPKTKLQPKALIYSSATANTADYTLITSANVAGGVQVTVNGGSPVSGRVETPDGRSDIPVKLEPGTNQVEMTFTPDAQQTFDDPDLELGSTGAVNQAITVTYDTRMAGRKYLYVAPFGSAMGDGSALRPLDVQTALDLAAPGQTIVVKGGRYRFTSPITMRKGMNGTQAQPIYLLADPAAQAKPVFDFTGASDGILLNADWWYLFGIGVTGAVGEGVSIGGSHNVLDQVDTYYNQATGIQISRVSRVDATIDRWPSYNLVLNCTSYGNADPGYSDADGFGAKLTAGVGNVFDGCVAYHNADDGWDLYAKAENGPIGKTVVKNCVAYGNGYLEDGTNAGDGNGFKLGGESITAYHELRNSFAFNNKNCGVTTNSCPDVQVYDTTIYNNEKNNLSLYTKLAKNTDFAAQGVLSMKDSAIKSGKENGDNFAPVGSQDKSKYTGNSNYYWDGAKTVNDAGTQVEADVFASLDFKGFTRRSDGTVDLGDFLKKTDKAPADAGADGTGTPSLKVEPIAVVSVENGVTITAYPDGEHVFVTAGANGDKVVDVTDAASLGVAVVSIPTGTPAPAAPFADVSADHWAAQAVNALAGMELVKGVDETAHVYDLTSPVTRSSLAQMLTRLCQGQGGSATFSDVAADAWYAKAVAWCAQSGVVTGYAGGTFGPDDPITREQLCLMLQRCANLLGAETSKTAALNDFADAAKVSPWAQNAMAWAVEAGIVTGKDGKTLDPQGTASRAETAAMVWRFVKMI